jgi:hypothetical protein
MRPRRATWWLCLLVALLPLRGLAHGWMLGSLPGMVSGAGLVAMAPSDLAAHAPCHAVDPPAAASPATDGTDAGEPAPHPGCALCDLCHSPLARVGEPVWALPTPAGDGPASTPRRVAHDAPAAGIFRPPRG